MTQELTYKFLPGTVLTDTSERYDKNKKHFGENKHFYVVVKQVKESRYIGQGDKKIYTPAYFLNSFIGIPGGNSAGSFTIEEDQLVRADVSKADIEKLISSYEEYIKLGSDISEKSETLKNIKIVYSELLTNRTEDQIKNENIVSNWNDLPEVWRVVRGTPKLAFTNSPYDKNLQKLLKGFLPVDETTNPTQVHGVFFADHGITATDKYKLIHLPYPNVEFNGIYCITTKCKKIAHLTDTDTIDGKYINYLNVVHTSLNHIHKISVQKLITFARASVLGKYNPNNNTTYAYNEVGPSEYESITFDTNYLITVLEACLHLGWQYAFIGISNANKSVYFSNSEGALKNPNASIGKHPILMLFPKSGTEVINNFNGMPVAAFDEYAGKALNLSYSLITDEIYNQDGSVAEFNYNLDKPSIKDLTVNQERALSAYFDKKISTPILGHSMVSNKTAYVGDFNDTLELKNVNKPDGIYTILNGAFIKQALSANEYPKPISLGYEANNKNFKKIGTINRAELLFNLEKAVICKDKNNYYNETFNGVHLIKKEAGALFIEASNGTNFYRNKIKTESLADIDIVIGSPEKLIRALKNDECTNVGIYTSGANASFVMDDLTASHKLIAGKFPAAANVIPESASKLMSIDVAQLRECLKALTKEDKADLLAFMPHELGLLNINLHAAPYGQGTAQLKRQLCQAPAGIKEGNYKPGNQVFLIMQTRALSPDAIFSVSVKLLENALAITESDQLNIYFDKPTGVLIIRDNDIEFDLDVINNPEITIGTTAIPAKQADINALTALLQLVNKPNDKDLVNREINKITAD